MKLLIATLSTLAVIASISKRAQAKTIDYCLPVSVLASQADFPGSRAKVSSVALLGAQVEAGLGAGKTDQRLELEALANASDVAAFEARCWLARAGLGSPDRDIWMMLGPLRTQRVGTRSWIWAADQPNGLDRVLRIPKGAGWDQFSKSLAIRSFERLNPDDQFPGPGRGALEAASVRWPKLATSWWNQVQPSFTESGRVLVVGSKLSLIPAVEEIVQLPKGDVQAALIYLPKGERYGRFRASVRRFLRMMSATHQTDLWVHFADDGVPPLDRLRWIGEHGGNPRIVVGPVSKEAWTRDAVASWRAEIPWLSPRTQRTLPDDLQPGIISSSPKEELVAHLVQFHRELGQKEIPGPVYVLGRPGLTLERWRKALEEVGVPESQMTALPFDPATPDLSGYARMVRAGKPGTLILAVRGGDAGPLLRYLAQAGLWPKVGGRKERRGELHTWMIAPSHFLHDPTLQEKNKSYLYGIRCASDIPPVSKWAMNPFLNRYLLSYREYPPRLGIRIAATLYTLGEAIRTGSFVPSLAQPSGDTVPKVGQLSNRPNYLEGDTPFGRLEWRDGVLMFATKTYIYKGRGFQEQKEKPSP